MNVVVQGTKNFIDYNIFLRSMGVALSDLKNDEFNVYTVGPAQINSFTAEFCNRSENSFKQRGIRIKFHRVPTSYVEQNLSDFDYFIFLSTPNEKISKLAATAELSGIEVGIFRY